MLFKKKPVTREEQIAALKEAVRLWNIGKYRRAVELYQRYGYTDQQFSQALVMYNRSVNKK